MRSPARSTSSSRPIDGVATIALDHPQVRAAIDDLANRGVRGRDPGLRRAELAPPALCRHRQSRGRTHGRDPDGPLPARPQRLGRRHRGLARAARPCRAAVRLPPDPVERISRACRRCRPSKAATTASRPASLTARCCRASPTSSASTASAPATAASRPRWRQSGRARDIVWIAHELTVHTRALPAARRDRRDHQPGPWSRGALRRARPARPLPGRSRSCPIRSGSTSTSSCATISLRRPFCITCAR